MTRAMILCAGFGTRLGALSDECPKPLLPVCDVPILRYGIANLVAHGIHDIVINLHHRGHLIREELGDGSSMGARIQYSVEEKVLGTGGGMKNALPLLNPEGTDEPFVSLNGKLIFDLDITKLLAEHSHDSLGTMVVKRVPNAMDWGAVDVNDEGCVTNILGQGHYMFCGVHVTRPSVVAKLPEGEACTVRQGYLPWIQGGGIVRAFVHEQGYFAEHSTPKRYLESNLALLVDGVLRHKPNMNHGVSSCAQIASSAKIHEPVFIGDGVVIKAGAEVGPHVVLGKNSVVEQGVRLSRLVAWPNAVIDKSGSHSIVTSKTWVDAAH